MNESWTDRWNDRYSKEEFEIELNEGLFHNGKGSVIRFVGKKISDVK